MNNMRIWTKIREFFSKRKRNNDGAGSIGLMVVSLTVTIMAGMVATSAYMSLAVTYDQLSQREADAAAETALNDAVGRFTAGSCGSANGTTTNWRWQIFKTANDKMPLSAKESGMFLGCPTLGDKWVLIVVTGKGRDNTFSNKTAVYRVFGEDSLIEAPETNIGLVPQAITGKKITLRDNLGIQQDSGVSGSNGSMFIGAGGLTCVNSEMRMNIASLNGTPANQFSNCPVYGDVTTARAGYFNADSYLYGDMCSAVNMTSASRPMVKGVRTESAATCGPKVKGTFYGYLPDPRDAVKFSGAQCNDWNTFRAAVMNMSGGDNMVDLRGCTATDLSRTINGTGDKTINLQGDVTILINEGMNAQKITVSSADGKPYNLNFATPSTVSNGSDSTCGLANSTNSYSAIKYNDGITGMFYSACNLSITGSTINGQIYAGETLDMSSSKLTYSLVGLPYAFRPVVDIGKAQQLTRVY